jgi:hypothetical protein
LERTVDLIRGGCPALWRLTEDAISSVNQMGTLSNNALERTMDYRSEAAWGFGRISRI